MRWPSIRIAHRYRRAILIYLLTIVTPVCVLLWLGIESFERQRQALATLTAEKIDDAIAVRTREVAERAFVERGQPIATHFFVYENGVLVSPQLRAPLPEALPAEFAEAERLEREDPGAAVAAYRALAARGIQPAVALSRAARALALAGRDDDARRTWREVAARYPDERDPSGRPFGITAALQAGDTAGLLDAITTPRWELAADQAEYFVSELGGGAEQFLDRYRFARELAAEFRPPASLPLHQLQSDVVHGRTIFYRAEAPGRIRGFAASRDVLDDIQAWVRTEHGFADPQARDLRIRGGAVAVVSLLLTAGVVLLIRDTSRETRTNELRADFVSGVSHELKTPITLVRLYGETLLRHDTFSEAERRDFYRIITRESARLGRLVDQVLSFSRIERGELKFEMIDGDLAPHVRGTVEDYSEWLEQSGFTVTCTVPESAPPVRFDEAAVAQALVNLLDNAAKYSGTAREIRVRLTTGERDVRVDVEDRGIGIARGELPKIFARFYRASGSTGKGGYGLGLFMVQHLMTVHGGRVEVESALGQGSRFTLVFPRA